MPDLNTQTAPWPDELEDLVSRCRYRPGWLVKLAHLDRGQGSEGLTLDIITSTVDTYDPDRPISIHHFFPVPPAAYNRASWQRWLFDQFRLVEQHECQEFFQIDGARPYAPMHGPGNDPYIIPEYHDDVQRRTSFRGEVEPARA